jgi:hypothetical protein
LTPICSGTPGKWCSRRPGTAAAPLPQLTAGDGLPDIPLGGRGGQSTKRSAGPTRPSRRRSGGRCHCPPSGKADGAGGLVRFATNCRTVSRASRRWPSAANLECARYWLGIPAMRVLGEPGFQLLSEARPTKLPRHDDHWPGSTNGRGFQVHRVPRRPPSAQPGLLGSDAMS